LWTTSEIKALRTVAYLGTEVAAQLLRRSPEACRQQAKRSGISLARPAKDDELHRLDAARVEQVVRLLGPLTPFCRRCDSAPTETGELVGLCRKCRHDDVARSHAIVADELVAQKRMDAERQRVHRAAGALKRRSARVAYGLDLARWENDRTDLRPRPRLDVWQRRYAVWFPSRTITAPLRESAQSPQESSKPVRPGATPSNGSRRSDAVSPP
jgi:hypothetical protein